MDKSQGWEWWKKNKLFLLVVVQWGEHYQAGCGWRCVSGVPKPGGAPNVIELRQKKKRRSTSTSSSWAEHDFDFCSVGDRQMKLLNQDGHS
jgi:hypothetical protein